MSVSGSLSNLVFTTRQVSGGARPIVNMWGVNACFCECLSVAEARL